MILQGREGHIGHLGFLLNIKRNCWEVLSKGIIWPDPRFWMVSTALWTVDWKAGRGKAGGCHSVSVRGDGDVDTGVRWREVE